MKRGIAFIRGMGMFGSKNYTKEEIMGCLKEIRNKAINIIGMYGNDNVIFEKEEMHYASVGKLIERCLERKFNERFFVTTRSMDTIKGIAGKFG
ncbi:MAG: hypothetical protein U9O96_03145 [Candidatus Thermoplasmatota archaeon]|nr:hypothetical protein [Candidatus Thermoplasmatota archaeon]